MLEIKKLPAGKFISREIKKRNLCLVEHREGLDQAHFIFAFHSPCLGQKEKYAYDIALTYLAGGMSSVLFNEIRSKRGIAYDIRPDIDSGKNYGYSTIYAGTSKEKIKEVEEIIRKEIKNLKNLTIDNFEDTKEQLIGLKKIEEESSSQVMNALLIEEFGAGAEEYYNYGENLAAVTIEEVRKISNIENFSTLALIPE